jgi:hypothetical protein
MLLRSRTRKSATATRTARPRRRGVTIIGKHGHVLGFVEARAREAAEAAAITAFKPSHEQRKRRVVQEQS